MACGFVLRILLIFLVQAEHVCSLSREAEGFQNEDKRVGFLLGGGQRNFGNPLNQVRRVLVSPRLIQKSGFNGRSAVDGGSGQVLSTCLQALSSARCSVQNSVQSSARLVKSHLMSTLKKLHPASLRAGAQSEPRNLGRMGPVPSRQSTPRSKSALSPSRNLYSFSPASGQSAAQKTPNYNQMGVSAFLSGPAAPRPRGGHVQTKTYASAPAKKVSSPRSLRPRGWQSIYKPRQGSRVYNLAVPRSSRVRSSAVVYEIPNRYGGFAIRRVKEPANQVEVQQVSSSPQWMAAYKPSLSKVSPQSKWTRVTVHKL